MKKTIECDVSHILSGTEDPGYRIKGFIKALEEEADKMRKRGAKDIRVVSVRSPFGVRVLLRGKNE